MNRPGAYACECKAGYAGDGRECSPAQDCDDVGLVCHPDATCEVVNGEPGCLCKDGFEGDGLSCDDIDECAQGRECGDNAECVNERGGSRCRCDALSETADDGSCKPSCEIAKADPSRCAPQGVCALDSAGSARCRYCESGYLGDGAQCVEDAECQALDCVPNMVCSGVSGARSCVCAPGFVSNADGACVDVDECESKHGCDTEAEQCINTVGGFVCDCADGFDRVDGECRNVDECTAPVAPCDPNAQCVDTSPGYTCTCSAGFEGSGASCSDIDECALGDHDCIDTDACANTAGGFECGCGDGYAGDGRSEACYCDLSGYWAMRQDVVLRIPEQSLGGTVFIQEGQTHATVWELHKYEYDGSVIRTTKRGCGSDSAPQVYSPFYEEVYASSVPNHVFDKLPPAAAQDIPLASDNALPGKTFMTPLEAAVVGIELDDRETSPWPASSQDVAAEAWVDADNDGIPGISMWPGSTLDAPASGLAETYSYLPVELEGSTTIISRRAGCLSIGTRVLTTMSASIERCDRITGEVQNLASEVRIHSCMVLGSSDWDSTEIKCDANSWRKARKCTPEQVDFLDSQEQNQTASATYELIKLGPLSGPQLDCQAARDALPAIVRP